MHFAAAAFDNTHVLVRAVLHKAHNLARTETVLHAPNKKKISINIENEQRQKHEQGNKNKVACVPLVPATVRRYFP